MKDLAILDLETSGINPQKHSVLEIGIVPLDDKKPIFHCYVRPINICWTDFAKKNFQRFLHKWETEAVSATEALKLLEAYVSENFNNRKLTLIGHNIGFDVSFLKKLASDAGLEEIPYFSHRAIDTHTLLFLLNMKGKIPDSALSSDGAFSHFGIEVQNSLRHTALGDAAATKELFRKVISLL